MTDIQIIQRIILECFKKDYDPFSVPVLKEDFDKWLDEERYYPAIFSKELAYVLGYTIVGLAIWCEKGNKALGYFEEMFMEDKKEDSSSKKHCQTCLDEKELGYGDDIDGCCCTHLVEANKKRGK